MKYRPHSRPAIGFVLSGICLWAACRADAQFFPQPGGTPGTTGGRTTGRSSGGSGGTRDYPNNTQVGEATISSDPEGRKLIIVTDEDTNLKIKEIISNLDKPKPQVLIKVVFLEITHNKSSDIGIEGGWTKNNIGNGATSKVVNAFGLSGLDSAVGSNAVNAFGQNVQSFIPTPPGAGLYQVLGQDYQATLRAIAQAGNAEVLSRPSILARNSQPATITVGQSVPLISNVRFDTFGNAINSVTYTDVGVILKVTPFITGDGLVEMILSPELSSVSQTDRQSISAGVTAPVIDKRTADTVVVTPDGQTVVVGGLMGRTKAQAESKVPFLGDIPLLGNLFKRKTKSDVKTELMIFLTPHVIQAPSQLAKVSDEERNKVPMTPEQFSEKELNQFLEGLPFKKPADDKAPKPPKQK